MITEEQQREIERLEQSIDYLRRTIGSMEQSPSWRLTAPLRRTERSLRKIQAGVLRFSLQRKPRRQVLVVDERFPSPQHDSGSLRAFRLLGVLRDIGCDITFITGIRREGWENAHLLRKAGCRIADETVQAHLISQGHRYDTVILCRGPNAIQHIDLVRTLAPQAHIVFDSVDLYSLRVTREARVTGDAAHLFEAEDYKQAESRLIREADCTIVVSEFERALIMKLMPDARAFVVSNIHLTPGSHVPFDRRKDILFLGNFFHRPNVDTIRYLVNEIMPGVRRLLPGIRLHVLGQYDPADIGDLASDDVLLHGHVPDLAGWFANVRLSVAPLRYGAGVKGKIHMSLAFGVPVVTSSIGAEGMHINNGIHCLIADDAEAFAEAIHRLYTDRPIWERFSQAGPLVIAEHFSTDVAKQNCLTLFKFLDASA